MLPTDGAMEISILWAESRSRITPMPSTTSFSEEYGVTKKANLLRVRILQIEVGVLLATNAGSRRQGPNITDVAPVRYLAALAVFVNEHRDGMNRIDLKMIGRGKVADC